MLRHALVLKEKFKPANCSGQNHFVYVSLLFLPLGLHQRSVPNSVWGVRQSGSQSNKDLWVLWDERRPLGGVGRGKAIGLYYGAR